MGQFLLIVVAFFALTAFRAWSRSRSAQRRAEHNSESAYYLSKSPLHRDTFGGRKKF